MKKFDFLLSLILLLAVGCDKKSDAGETNVVKVKVMEVKADKASSGHHFSGTIEENNGSVLSFPVNGKIKGIYVTQGQKVRRGQLIADLDDELLANVYDASKAVLEQTEDAFRRMKQLHDNNSLSEIDWMDIQTRLRQAQSAEQIAKRNLNDVKLYAPFDGIIAEKNAEPGQNTLPGAPIVKIVTTDIVKVKIAVPEEEISAISIGDKADVSVPAASNLEAEAVIVEKGINANSLSRSYEVKATINNNEGKLMPGMICEMTIDDKSDTDEIVIPTKALLLDNKNFSFVWLADSAQKARKQYVQVEKMATEGVVISEGLKSGDRIIVEGTQKVGEGSDLVIETLNN